MKCDGNCPDCSLDRCVDVPLDIQIFQKNFNNEVGFNKRMMECSETSEIKSQKMFARMQREKRERKRYIEAIMEVNDARI